MSKHDGDGCMKRTADAKEAGGITVFLVEELSDARMRCQQLKAYVKEAIDLVENSEKRDQLFETAAHLIHGIPDTLFKLEKALDAAAMSGARLDYEEIKQTLKPEKADQLEDVLQDVRLRYLQRRSEEQTTMTPKQAAEQLLAIADETQATGSVPLAEVMTLLASLEASAPQVKTARTAVDRAEDFRRWAVAMKTNPNRGALADMLRSVIGTEILPTSAQVAASIYQTASSREQVMKGFKKSNPHMTDEQLEKAADMWEKHQNVVKDKHATEEVTAYPKNLSVSDNTVGTTVSEVEAQVARFEKGKPADPTKGMSPEDAKAWKQNTDEHKDDFKTAAETTKAEWEQALKRDEAMLVNVRNDIKKMADGEQVTNLTLPNAKQIESALEQVIANKKKLLTKFATEETPVATEQPVAKFEKGKPADPTKGMSPEDAAAWKQNTEEHKDDFKAATAEAPVATEQPVAKFEKGKPADPTKDMSPEDAAEWKKQNDEHKDNFKAASAWKA